jgi:nicotinamidase-related amidase
MDTHSTMQIFHPVFWLNQQGENPTPHTNISYVDVISGTWKVNPALASSLNYDYDYLQEYALHYVKTLENKDKYSLTIWPYHSILGGIGHALVSSVEEALFFHNLVRQSQTLFELKGSNPLTENYSVLSPEILNDAKGKNIAPKNTMFLQKLLNFDGIIVGGQAKSHCVAWTIADLLTEIEAIDPNLAQKIYLLEDCTSPVVVPGIVDFSEQADAAFKRFAEAGMHLVKSTQSIRDFCQFFEL